MSVCYSAGPGSLPVSIFHYTDKAGYNAIRSAKTWVFKAAQPRNTNPVGAYFTSLTKEDKYLAAKLGVSREKTGYFFEFTDAGDLERLYNERGKFIFYAPKDYHVVEARHVDHGPTGR